MYVPLQVRLTLFYVVVLGVALWFFGYTVYGQAEQRAYRDLDTLLSTRAQSVQLGKSLGCFNTTNGTFTTLSSVDALGTGGVAIVVLGFAVVGGWFMTWGVLTAVRRMTRTAQSISGSHNFRQRVADKGLWRVRDELATLATTFNEMLANLEQVYEQQQRFVADASH